eukprot:gene9591-6744_t
MNPYLEWNPRGSENSEPNYHISFTPPEEAEGNGGENGAGITTCFSKSFFFSQARKERGKTDSHMTRRISPPETKQKVEQVWWVENLMFGFHAYNSSVEERFSVARGI